MLPFVSHFSGLKIWPVVLSRVLSTSRKMKGAIAGNSRLCQCERPAPRGTHSMAEFRSTKECRWNGTWNYFPGLVLLEAKWVGKIPYLEPIGRAWHQAPWVETEEVAWPPTVYQWKMGFIAIMWPQSPSTGVYRHTWTQEWGGTLQDGRDVIPGNRGGKGNLSGYPHDLWA